MHAFHYYYVVVYCDRHYVLRKKDKDMLVDGWKWLARGSRRLPHKNPQYRRALYFYRGQDGQENTFKRFVYE